MHYYLALTSKCNLLCKYCYGKTSEDFLSDEERKHYDLELASEMNFSVDELKKFALKDKNFELTFYGGEPLLKIDTIKKIMDEVPAKTFMLQTNGMFLNKFPSEYINRLNTILVSIDGTLEHTNERRGNKVFEKVIANLKLIKSNGFNGEIIARMTVDETSDVFKNVTFLFENNDFKFDSIHWQLDAQFWRADYKERDFKAWALNQYNPKIKKLVEWWVEKIKSEKKVPKIYPFVGVMQSLLTGEKSPMKCGSGFSLLGIQTNGHIVACPITAGYKPFKMGDIRESSLAEVEKNKIYPDNTCLDCEILDVCGGRCLYANKTKLWGEKGFLEVCDTVFFLVNSLKSVQIEIEKMIENGELSLKDFDYRKYNGCEIIP
ncbi:MAG: TIGR04084 family radical SAM/SPASM domain-containing protein [Nanoarchaeota archaeon]|nr:TIGR04084 family radical SAM/SPASM domain-containing protein [Nanoarchaeota archaeon]